MFYEEKYEKKFSNQGNYPCYPSYQQLWKSFASTYLRHCVWCVCLGEGVEGLGYGRAEGVVNINKHK